MSRFVPQYVYEGDEKSILHVVIARDAIGHLGAGRIEYVACNETLAVGELIHALTVVVQGLDHLEALVPTIADLGRRHAQFGVTDAHYDTVGAALLWALEQGLGSGWTPEVKAAWSGAYTMVADVMRAAVGEPAPAPAHSVQNPEFT